MGDAYHGNGTGTTYMCGTGWPSGSVSDYFMLLMIALPALTIFGAMSLLDATIRNRWYDPQ